MTNTNETIFALSTVFGKSGVAVIRISGNYALKALNHFHIKKEIKPRFATLVDLYDDSSQLIDNGIIIYFPAPNSFTGEDVVELQVHGSKAVIKIILEELSKVFVMAKPGEFSLRAFLNGKFDLTQLEGIADLIDAETKMQAKQAIKQISGELERLYSNWRQRLITIQSKIEAYIDFPEDVWTAYSSIGHIGFIFASLSIFTQAGTDSALMYLVIYIITSIGLFSYLVQIDDDDCDIANLSGIGKKRPIVAFHLFVLLLSMSGIPPLAGFIAKFFIFKSLINSGFITLSLILVMASVISCYYYLNIIKAMYFDKASGNKVTYSKGLFITTSVASLINLVLFLYVLLTH